MSLNAQINKGANLLGGTINFYSTQGGSGTETANSNRVFNFVPVYGKAIKDNFIIGGQIILGKTTSKQQLANNGVNKSTINSLGLGGFTRGYRNLGNSGFYVFLENNLSFSYAENKFTSNAGGSATNNKAYRISYSLYPGISYALHPKWQIETGLSNLVYAIYDHPNSTTKTSSFNAGIGIGNISSFSVGAKYILGN
ncbi:MAG: hypothetical protein IPH58_04265 [Sphingobacteriales bacterium]|nr:hypothetical protein [Sphingobacteriales bacterium]